MKQRRQFPKSFERLKSSLVLLKERRLPGVLVLPLNYLVVYSAGMAAAIGFDLSSRKRNIGAIFKHGHYPQKNRIQSETGK